MLTPNASQDIYLNYVQASKPLDFGIAYAEVADDERLQGDILPTPKVSSEDDAEFESACCVPFETDFDASTLGLRDSLLRISSYNDLLDANESLGSRVSQIYCKPPLQNADSVCFSAISDQISAALFSGTNDADVQWGAQSYESQAIMETCQWPLSSIPPPKGSLEEQFYQRESYNGSNRARTLTWVNDELCASNLQRLMRSRAQTFGGECMVPTSLPMSKLVEAVDASSILTPISTPSSFFSYGGEESVNSSPRTAKGKRPLNAKNRKCSFPGCGKAFGSRSHLERHERIHTKEKNFKCPVENCNALFNRQDNMRQHYRVHLRKLHVQANAGSHDALETLTGSTKRKVLSSKKSRIL